jgi:CheY-like chemotaxis protein
MGNGLSLSIAHSIVVKSGGYISASSEDGRRTSFEILLPRVGIAPGPSDEFEPEESVESEAPTILLVEDEDSVRRLMHRYLEEEGYALLEAANGKAAQEIADSYQRPIHVLVTDVVMPGVTGPELAQKLAPRRPDMKVLFVSGYRHDTLEHQGLLRHEVNLLAKPFPGPELVRRVRVLLGRGARLAH